MEQQWASGQWALGRGEDMPSQLLNKKRVGLHRIGQRKVMRQGAVPRQAVDELTA
jgi:hypothetical protein